jgi:hypothetical protein
MENIFVPAEGLEDWKNFLAKKDRQWKSGYSAKSLAYSWQNSEGFPKTIKNIFQESGVKLFNEAKILFAFPEYKVPLAGGTQESQNDIFIIAKGANELISITVEGKVSEGFDQTIKNWIKDISENSGKPKRLEFLKNILGLGNNLDIKDIRYQLLHRTASALIKAKELNASNALLLIHSFSQTDKHLNDYLSFLNLFNLKGAVNNISGPVNINGINLYFTWVRGENRFLDF